MRRIARTVVGIVFLSVLVAAAPWQGTPPPQPQPTPAPICPPGLNETCNWAIAFLQNYGPSGLLGMLIVAAGILLFRSYGQGVLKVWKKQGEQDAERVLFANEVNAATRQYLEKAIEDFRYFKFRGLGARERNVATPELDQAFISLRMSPDGERKEPQSGKDKAGQPELIDQMASHEISEAVDLAEAIRRSPKLAIIGVAGSGKSTLLQWAGLAAARARVASNLLKEEQVRFVKECGKQPLLPILIPLRAFNRFCKQKACAHSAAAMLRFLQEHIAEKHPSLSLAGDYFAHHLKSTGCLMMFDGLDEVDPEERQHVRSAIEGLVAEYKDYPRNRYLVTSRTYAYFGASEVSGFKRCEVQNLSTQERNQLIHSWYLVVDTSDEGVRTAEDLCRRIDQSDPRVRDLAVTPLMVTIFALVRYDQRELPRQRAELYEHAIRILLTGPYKEGEAEAGLGETTGIVGIYRLSDAQRRCG
jgi:hypothetical protein